MNEQSQSRFVLNLMTQFVLAFFLSVLTAMVNADGPQVVLSALASIAWLTFSFGFFYGLFRAFGLRSAGLESFYQSFPFGMGKGSYTETDTTKEPKRAPAEPFDWHKLFSFQYLRFIGVLLIITSVFSLLFNIEWALLYKIIAAAISGLILLGGAEWLRTRKGGISPFLAILSFALLQFSLTLTYQYALSNGWPVMLTSPDTWLYAKIGLTVVLLFTMTRYPAAWMPLLYVLVGWFSVTSLSYVGGSVSPMAAAVFVVALSAITLVAASALKRIELLIANVFLANITLEVLLLPEATNVRNLFLIVLIGIFAAQLLTTVMMSAKEPREVGPHIVNIVIAHIGLLIGVQAIRYLFPLIDTYIGVAFLVLANITLLAYLLGKKMKSSDAVMDVMFNAAVILASIGLFIQVDGPWSAVIFLAYSTLVLWFSLYRQNIRTRVYGCVLLLVSSIKLYTEFSGIFDKIWGCVAIMVIGLLLVVLSYKFEAVKDVFMHGVKSDKKA